MTKMKLTGMIAAAYKPNAFIGTIGEPTLAAKAIEVVLAVTEIAFAARLKLYAILPCWLLSINGLCSDCRQASQKTKMLSAAIPSTMKMIS